MRKLHTLRVIAAMASARVSRSMADAPSFWSAFFVDSSLFVLQALVFYALFLRVDTINGWDKWRAVFFVGTFSLVDSLFMFLFFFGIIRLPELISTGELDRFLARPVDPLIALSFERIDPGSAFLGIPALAIIGIAAAGSGWAVGPLEILRYVGAVGLMLVLCFQLMVLVRVPSFWIKRAEALQNVENSFMEFAFKVPGTAYRGAFKIVFRVVLPYGLIASFPAEAFFGEASALSWIGTAATVAAFALLARGAWKFGLQRYSGAGS
jgi:ABC-2 type transport system permease protein